MLSKEWIFEAETNIQVKKNLNFLSISDIETILQKLNMLEARSKYVSLKKSSDKPIPEPIQKNNPLDLDNIVKNLSEKDKDLLAKVLQKEKEERIKNSPNKNLKPEQTQPKNKITLGKILLSTLIALGINVGIHQTQEYYKLPDIDRKLRSIDAGMNIQDVMDIMGKKPDEKYQYGYAGSETEWHYNGAKKGIIHFADGKVMYVLHGEETVDSDNSRLNDFREEQKYRRARVESVKIKIGMTYSDVVQILGSPEDEISDINTRYGNSSTYRWKTGPGLMDNLFVSFDNYRVDSVSK